MYAAWLEHLAQWHHAALTWGYVLDAAACSVVCGLPVVSMNVNVFMGVTVATRYTVCNHLNLACFRHGTTVGKQCVHGNVR
jgi:hypothetical protein